MARYSLQAWVGYRACRLLYTTPQVFISSSVYWTYSIDWPLKLNSKNLWNFWLDPKDISAFTRLLKAFPRSFYLRSHLQTKLRLRRHLQNLLSFLKPFKWLQKIVFYAEEKIKKMLLFIIQGHFTKICTPLSVNRILEALY